MTSSCGLGVVSTLIEKNKEAQAAVDNLTEGLTKSQGEITQLNEQLSDALQEKTRDRLTALSHRFTFDERVVEEFDTAMRTGVHMSLVLLELDRYKEITDFHGDRVGDGLIKMFATILKNSMGPNDFAARYAVSQFALILPGQNLQDANQLVRKVLSRLDNSKVVVKRTGTDLGGLSYSAGISTVRPGIDSAELVYRTEQCLEEAKEIAGNKIKLDIERANAA